VRPQAAIQVIGKLTRPKRPGRVSMAPEKISRTAMVLTIISTRKSLLSIPRTFHGYSACNSLKTLGLLNWSRFIVAIE